MPPQIPNTSDDLDVFRLHSRHEGRRCVISYETLEAALEKAFRKLKKDPQGELWITDAGRRVLLDATALRAEFAHHSAREGKPRQ
jgi:hypothetical protein